jgi:phenylalanine-4-hydroxylase
MISDLHVLRDQACGNLVPFKRREGMKTEMLLFAAPYIIQQDYSAYTEEQHSVWTELVGRVLPELEKHAAEEYLDGFQMIGIQENCLPNLASISPALHP